MLTWLPENSVTCWTLAAASAVILNYPNKRVFNKLTQVDTFLCYKLLNDSIIVAIINIIFSITEENQRLWVTFSESQNSLCFYIYVNKWQAKSNPKELANSFIAF